VVGRLTSPVGGLGIELAPSRTDQQCGEWLVSKKRDVTI